MLRERLVTAGEIIIKQGDKGDSMFLIMRGVIRVIRDDEELATLMAGEFFGEIAMLHHKPRMATCQAITPSALYELRSKDFEKLVKILEGFSGLEIHAPFSYTYDITTVRT